MTTDDEFHREDVIGVRLAAGATRSHGQGIDGAGGTRWTNALAPIPRITGPVSIVALARLHITIHGVGIYAIVRVITARRATPRLGVAHGTLLTHHTGARRILTLEGLGVTGRAGRAVNIVETLNAGPL